MQTDQTRVAGAVRITIELIPGSDPIRGRIAGAPHVGEEFVGWLGLAAAIERLAGSSTNQEEES